MPPKNKNGDRNSRLQIILAIIGLVGVISAAIIANFDKLWPKATDNRNDSSANSNSHLNPTDSSAANRTVGPKPVLARTVALMDNNLLTYNKNRGSTGRTNQSEIEDALKDLGLRFVPIATYLNWSDYAKLEEVQPDLIIIHVSAFYDKTDPNDKGNRFRTFLENAMPSLPKTKLLVYSRAFQDVTTSDVAKYASGVPNLRERVNFFLVPGGPQKEYFNDMEIGGKLRKKVKQILELP